MGKTARPLKARIAGHVSLAGRSSLLHVAIGEHGKESFSWEVLAGAQNAKMLSFIERHFIRLMASIAPHGYNMNAGGSGPSSHTEATKKRIGDTLRGRKPTPEARANVSRSLMGHEVSPETRRKIGDANRGFKHKQETIDEMSRTRMGREISDEAKANMAIAQQKARKYRTGKCSPNRVRVDGVFYYSMKEAGEKTGIYRKTLARVAVMSGDGVLDVDTSKIKSRKSSG